MPTPATNTVFAAMLNLSLCKQKFFMIAPPDHAANRHTSGYWQSIHAHSDKLEAAPGCASWCNLSWRWSALVCAGLFCQ
jgi:hypothetical protein